MSPSHGWVVNAKAVAATRAETAARSEASQSGNVSAKPNKREPWVTAVGSGTEYQNRVAAWAAVRILAEQAATSPLDLGPSTTFDFLRCETLEPVDDLLIGLSNTGHAFLQAKHTIALGATADSDFVSVIEQFVRQFQAHTVADPQPLWDRPLDKSLDRLVFSNELGLFRTRPRRFAQNPWRDSCTRSQSANRWLCCL